MVDRIFGVVGDVAATAGMTVVVVEQDVRSALKIADRGVILRSGSVVADWPKDQIPAAAELWSYF
jgi:branched-chain amino acid transport system ATP-binding protein